MNVHLCTQKTKLQHGEKEEVDLRINIKVVTQFFCFWSLLIKNIYFHYKVDIVTKNKYY